MGAEGESKQMLGDTVNQIGGFKQPPFQETDSRMHTVECGCILGHLASHRKSMNDDQFLAAFEACTLEDFHHRDHIKVAYLYLCKHSLPDAIIKVRNGLQALAAKWNAPTNELEKGYHETMTQAWVRLVHSKLTASIPRCTADKFCDCHPELLQKDCLNAYYSRAHLFTWQAKREYVEPDLTSFS